MTRIQIATLMSAALLSALPAAAQTYSYQTINNSADPAFNQLLGINNSHIIVGYDGDGTLLPNKGYSVTPPYGPNAFTNENFPGSAQTQVVGINNNSAPTTVGFYVDGIGNNFGFVNQGGTFVSVQNPNTAMGGTAVNQLLGVNNNNIAAGFYVDGNGNSQGYLYNIANMSFSAVSDPDGVATVATGINNGNVVSGFFTDAGGNDHGFLEIGGVFDTFDDPNGTNTMFLGLNNAGQAVGSYVDANGVTQGLIFNLPNDTWQTISDPNASSNAAFNVTGTTVNGINDLGQIVGFYSDGTNVDGFGATPTPEPASIALLSLGLIGAGLARKIKRY